MSVQTVARWAGTLTKRIGDGPPDAYGDPTTITVDEPVRGVCWQVSASEDTVGGQLSREDWRIVLAGYVACAATDRVTLGSFGTFELIGPPHHVAYPPFGVVHHTEVAGRRVV